MDFYEEMIFEDFSNVCSGNIFLIIYDTNSGSSYADRCTYMMTYRLVILKLEMCQTVLQGNSEYICYFKSCFFENHSFYEIIWKIVV